MSSKFSGSLISQEIQELLQDLSIISTSSNDGGFILPDLTLNWSKISELFNPFEDLSHEKCKQIIPLHRKVWREAEYILCQGIHVQTLKNIPLNFYSWTDRKDFLEKILNKFFDEQSSPCRNIEITLVLSAVIEYALGNVFYTISGKTPPHLLRELLATKELEEVFGRIPLFFIQILMGTANGINLRNIVWHGFPAPQEIPLYYPCILLFIIFSLGKILDVKNVMVEIRKIPYNPVDMINDEIFLDMPWKRFKDEEILGFMRLSGFISADHLIFWEEILQNSQRGNYSSAIILFLPQFELILRKIFGKVNGMDVMARIGSYYIILDTFMAEQLPESEERNCIHDIFNPGLLHLFHDFFMAPKGPRIRDKISHGELSLEEITNEDILNKLITLALGVLAQMLEVRHTLSDLMSSLTLRDYRSQFHQNGRLMIDLKDFHEKLKEFSCLKIPESLNFNTFSLDLDHCHKEVFPVVLEIFFRPPEEAEIVGILSKILKNALCAKENFLKSLQERLSLFNAKLLRSKRRETLLKCLELVPKIHSWLQQLLLLIEKVFCLLQMFPQNEEWKRVPQDKVKKLLRKIQKYSENLTHSTQMSSNDWMKSSLVMDKSVEVFEKIIVLLN